MVRAVVVGSGSAGLNEAQVAEATIALTGKAAPSVVYLGTATYDLPEFRERQTVCFGRAGCDVRALDLAMSTPPADEVAAVLRHLHPSQLRREVPLRRADIGQVN